MGRIARCISVSVCLIQAYNIRTESLRKVLKSSDLITCYALHATHSSQFGLTHSSTLQAHKLAEPVSADVSLSANVSFYPQRQQPLPQPFPYT